MNQRIIQFQKTISQGGEVSGHCAFPVQCHFWQFLNLCKHSVDLVPRETQNMFSDARGGWKSMDQRTYHLVQNAISRRGGVSWKCPLPVQYQFWSFLNSCEHSMHLVPHNTQNTFSLAKGCCNSARRRSMHTKLSGCESYHSESCSIHNITQCKTRSHGAHEYSWSETRPRSKNIYLVFYIYLVAYKYDSQLDELCGAPHTTGAPLPMKRSQTNSVHLWRLVNPRKENSKGNIICINRERWLYLIPRAYIY